MVEEDKPEPTPSQEAPEPEAEGTAPEPQAEASPQAAAEPEAAPRSDARPEVEDDAGETPAPETPMQAGSAAPAPPAEAAAEEDFASMLEESLEARAVQEGQTVTGALVSLTDDAAFIDIGGKGEATMDPAELRGNDGELQMQVGDRVEAVVVSTAGGIKLSHKLARSAASREQLQDAFRSGLPVEGKVVKSIKGGFEVRVSGQRGFCPGSQMDLARGTAAAEHEGKLYTFRILELKDGGKNLVLSRRALLAEQQRQKAGEVMKRIEPGAELSGKVASVRDYGAFVDLGAGIQGLLHVSEMGWSRVASAGSVVKVGDEISVQVLKVDRKARKISLSLKHLQADPWTRVGETYTVGQVVEGRISRVADFGAFVELEPGIEALAHMSTFPSSKDGWKAAAQVGESAEFRIQSVEPDRRRIGIAPADYVPRERRAPSKGKDGRGPSKPGGKPAGRKRPARPDPVPKLPEQPQAEGFGSLADKLRAAMEQSKEDGEK